MSVILEFTIDDEGFRLGQVLAPPPEMQIELERVVPTGEVVMPYLWATGCSMDAFETKLGDHAAVSDLRKLDEVDDSRLYRILWKDPPADLIKSISETDATMLEGKKNGSWQFRLRFADHEGLSAFHDDITDQGTPIEIGRSYDVSEATDPAHQFDLTPSQREALVLALQEGYFASPSQVDLDELADEIGISRQAVSKRIRKGNERILRKKLL